MMKYRIGIALMLLSVVTTTRAEAPTARHGIEPDLKAYPQASPKETLTSVLKAAGSKRFDYLLAQLADPDWVDGRVATASKGFPEVVQETTAQLDAPRLKLLKQFLEQGEIETLDNTAVVRLKDNKERVVRLRKQNNRWYLRHSNKP